MKRTWAPAPTDATGDGGPKCVVTWSVHPVVDDRNKRRFSCPGLPSPERVVSVRWTDDHQEPEVWHPTGNLLTLSRGPSYVQDTRLRHFRQVHVALRCPVPTYFQK